MSTSKRAALISAGIVWFGVWFWAFSLAYSGFFAFQLRSRIPTFLAALVAVHLIPGNAIREWAAVRHGRRGRGIALAREVAVAVSALVLVFATAWILGKAPAPWRLEANDAMGVGIDLAALAIVVVATEVVLGVMLFDWPGGRGVEHEPPQR